MARLFPSASDSSQTTPSGPRVIGLDSDDADRLLTAVSSQTARDILAALHETPAAPSELTTAVDSSLQNIQYHLNRLEDAGIIEVIETVYSEKGREMNVYAPSDDPLVVVAGADEQTTTLRSILTNLLGGLGIIGLLAIVVQILFDQVLRQPAGTSDSASGDMSIMEASRAAPDVTTIVPPGVLFFAGGVIALAIVFGIWYLQNRR